MKKLICFTIILGIFFALAMKMYADVPMNIVNLVKKNVYEVLVEKLDSDQIKYEESLPFDQLSYSERNDKYISMGTAFAFKDGYMISAAHIIPLHLLCQHRKYYLRDINKNIYEVSDIYSYDDNKDFIVFELKDKKIKGDFEFNDKFDLNNKVYAVGNALGEGVVIREGLLTSSTPEVFEGAWNWIRFSAAVSPGNSGGPLLDKEGKVIGIITMRSENENLNYSLPVKEFINFPRKAKFYSKAMFVLPNLPFTESTTIDIKEDLPRPLSIINEKLSQDFAKYNKTYVKKILENNKAKIFPQDSGSNSIVYGHASSYFPYIILRDDDYTWYTAEPKDIQSQYIDNTGFIKYGKIGSTLYAKMYKPSGVLLNDLLNDSKKTMDYFLKGIPLYRTMGQKNVRIVSLGNSSHQEWFIDVYGRKWLIQIWNIPYNDKSLVCFFLPMPDGYTIMASMDSSEEVFDIIEDLKLYSRFVFIRYNGTFSEWQAFLDNKKIIPDCMKDLKLEYNKKKVVLKNKLFSLEYDSKILAITDRSALTISYKICPSKKGLELLPDAISIGEETYFSFTRFCKPNKDMRLSDFNFWKKIINKKFPFDRQVRYDDNSSYIQGFPDSCEKIMKTEKEKLRLIYSVVYSCDRKEKKEIVQNKLNNFLKNFKVKEQIIY